VTTIEVDPSTLSEAERIVRAGLMDELLAGMTRKDRAVLAHDWSFWRRPAQDIPPEIHRHQASTWLIRAGRGYGKTRTGAETTRRVVNHCRAIGLVGPTAADVRDVMVEGESGLLSVFPWHQRPEFIPSKRRIEFHNGAVATTYSAEEPDRLRGPQHEWLWMDEPAAYRYGKDVWDNASLGLRLGLHPWALLTGTPKPTAWLRKVGSDPRTVTTTGSTYENVAHLAPVFLDTVLGRYENTRLGLQELHAQWLDDVEGALWTEAIIEAGRWQRWTPEPGWKVAIGVDPPGETAECGIVVGAAPARPERNSDAVVIGDYSTAGPPEVWGARVVEAYREHGADEVVVEANQGGDMARAVIHAVDPSVPVAKARTREGKAARAEPVSLLYARQRVHHVGYFPHLESQMVTWVPGEGKSPDRLDAMVWLVASLLPTDALVQGSVISVASRRL
jgi:phage terminase large subunit-like protein